MNFLELIHLDGPKDLEHKTKQLTLNELILFSNYIYRFGIITEVCSIFKKYYL